MNDAHRYPELPATPLELEDDLLRRWREEELFEATLDATEDGEPFVFYEGPPTANGRPGLHHIISRTIKDLVCRHRTMKGRSVTRIAGWDTHGLPVEIEAEQALGVSGKPEIEELGVERFNRVCRDSVFTYKEEWERLSERIGYWLDYSRAYVTFTPEYVESVWWALAEIARKGLIYRGHKSVPYCPRCGTALSSHEVAQGYREVEDPSLTLELDLEDGSGRRVLVWTTTPWTWVANTALAVHPGLTYAEVERDGERYVCAEGRVEALFGEGVEAETTFPGSELVGLRYRRPVDLVAASEVEGDAWRIIPADFVSAEDGTGIVHIAPAFGAEDFQAGEEHELPLLRPVTDDGTFREGLDLVGGRFVKDADPVIIDDLRERGLVFDADRVVHSYPHCWRCDSPLLYMARESWFCATSTIKDRMLENNGRIDWHPPEVGEGRFGEWLANNVDWALSRDRYWGTPLPVWVCREDQGHVDWIGSYEELEDRVGPLPGDFDPHRPFIDGYEWPCPECGAPMRRTPEVIDAWFDSGSMPYAQWHYPFENREAWEDHFPADFIAEGVDQTRGWFYSLLAIASMLELGPAYRNVVVNDLILDAEGQKMSKSRGNVVDPWEALDEHGADAIRWYLITLSHPWVPKRYDPEGVRESVRKHFDTLRNTYRFFALYARVEGWEPSDDDPPPEERPAVDRWILSRLHRLVRDVGDDLDAYDLTHAARAVEDFVVDDLSNWYVRRSRPRFWGNADEPDARAAFRTLHHALRTVALLTAPATPFLSDWLHRALTDDASAHLARWPAADGERIDDALESEMEAVRALATLGRAAREEVGIRVRQPLRTLHAVVPGRDTLSDEALALLTDELNVKEVRFRESGDALVRPTADPDYSVLGPRFHGDTEAVAAAIRELDEDDVEAFRRGESVSVDVGGEPRDLPHGAFDVVEEARGDLVVRKEAGYTVALDPDLDDDLREEGLARELVNRIQRLRRDAGLEITDRIRLGIFGAEEVAGAAERYRDFIAGETLAVALDVAGEGSDEGVFQAVREVELDGIRARIGLSPRRRAGDPGGGG